MMFETLLATLGSALAAEPWTVCDDGIAPYAVIQHAIDAGETTISICPGTYHSFKLAAVEGVDIIGAGVGEVFVRSDRGPAMRARDSSFTMSGLTLTGFSREALGAAWDIRGSTTTITDVAIARCGSGRTTVHYGSVIEDSDAVLESISVHDNQVSGPIVYVAGEGTFVMRHSVFTRNEPNPRTGGRGATLAIYPNVDAEITNNIFYRETGAWNYMFIFTQESTHRTIVQNNVFWQLKDCAQSIVFDNAVEFSNNIVANNRCGVRYHSFTTPEASYNLLYNPESPDVFEGDVFATPRFTDPVRGDFTLHPDSPAIDAGDPAITDPDGSRSDMGAFGGPYGAW